MNSAIQNMAISLGAMQVARRIPFDDPVTLNYVRIGYVCSQLFGLATYYYIYRTIKKKNDKTVMTYEEPASPLSQGGPKKVTTTVRDYDLAETTKLVRSVFMGVAMMGVMHIYFNFTQPLFIQALMGLKSVYDASLVSIHVLGKPATGSLERPFKVASMFAAPAPEAENVPAGITDKDPSASISEVDSDSEEPVVDQPTD